MKVHPVQRYIFPSRSGCSVEHEKKETIRHMVSNGPTKKSNAWECFGVTLWSSNKNRSPQLKTK